MLVVELEYDNNIEDVSYVQMGNSDTCVSSSAVPGTMSSNDLDNTKV